MFKGLVLYTDGGTHNLNPGPFGYGIHGYRYTYQKPKKGIGISGYTPTQLGYMKKDNNILDPVDIDINEFISTTKCYHVTIDEIINIHGSQSEVSTNNVAELMGMICGLRYILDNRNSLDKIVIYSDSEYTVKGINERLSTWVKNNYLKSNGEEVANKEYWVTIYDLINELNQEKVNYNIYWIKGHDKNPGNEEADKLATIAANKSQQVIKGYIERNEEYSIFNDDYFSDKLEIHPFLLAKRFYFNPYSDLKHSRNGMYYLGELGDKVEDIYIGKEISDASLSVVKINQFDPVVELIKDSQREWLTRHNYNHDCIVSGALDVLGQKTSYNELFKFQHDLIKSPDRVRPDLFLLNQDKPITLILDPPYLSMRTLTEFTNLEEKAHQFLNGVWNQKAIDITDMFYQVKKDKKDNVIGKELKQEISSTLKSVNIEVDHDTTKKKITLTFGIDLPKRNALKRLESLDPTVYLLVWKIDESLYGYATLIKTKDNEWGIWMASYSGNYLI